LGKSQKYESGEIMKKKLKDTIKHRDIRSAKLQCKRRLAHHDAMVADESG